jgi:iron complex outermembrane recepter protein
MSPRSLRCRPLAAAVLACLCAPIWAQDSAPAADEAANQLDQIVVTGSNLKGIDLEDAQPVIVIDAERLRELGAISVSDILRQVTASAGGTGNFSTANSGALQADAPAGSAGASLRGLGTASTLTLINGRRVAVASFANGSENFVDLNAIPRAAIERIEVLTTGASAIYGADAVAGVVNIVLKRDFDGLRLGVSYGDSAASTDEARANVNLVTGFSGERARGMLVLDAFERNALYDRDRRITAVEPRPSQQGIFPSFIDFDNMDLELVERSCPDAQRFDGRPGFPQGAFGDYCALNRNQFTATDPALEQLGLYATFGYDLDGGIEYFAELAGQRNESQAFSAPAPWDVIFLVPLDHPNMPAELRQRLLAAGADPTSRLDAFGRFPDARSLEVETTNWRLLNGLRGTVGEWDWETALSVSDSQSEQRATAGIYQRDRFRAALRGRLCADGSTTCTPSTGGLFYNPFGGQASNSQQVLDLLRAEVPRDGESRLYGWDAKFTGSAGALAGGDIAWAIGVEARREEIADRPSPLAQVNPATGQVPVYGFGSTAAEAERKQWATYVESFLPFTETFDVRLAGRYDHYSDFGGDFNPAIGLRWRPNEHVVLRGGWNSAFRAPSLAQVGAGTTLSSGALPCSAGSEFLANFCGGSTRDRSYLSEIYGNPDLDAETSEAFYLGSAFAIGERSTLTVDYWNFDQRDLVDIDELELFRRALSDPSLVRRTANLPSGSIGIGTRDGTIGGRLEQVNLQLTNVGRQQTDGVDIGFDHTFAEQSLGELAFDLKATWVNSFERSESCSAGGPARRGAGPCVDGQRLVERAGEFRYPEWTLNTGFRLRHGDWFARLYANYVDGYYDDDQRSEVPVGRRVASWTTFNLTVGWDIDELHSVDLSIQNLADRDPPVALGSASNVDLYNHNTLGRFVTLNYVFRY